VTSEYNSKKNVIGDSFFNDCPLPAVIYDTETLKVIAVNDAAIECYGYSKEELMELHIGDLLIQDDNENIKEKVKKVVKKRYYDAGRKRHLRKNGDVFYCHSYSNPTVFNGRAARIVVFANIDGYVKSEKENKELAEEALKEKSNETINILESITDAFFAADKNWNLTYVNRAAEKMYKVKRESILYKNVWDVFPQTVNTEFYHGFYKAVRERIIVRVEGNSPASGRWVLATAYPTRKGIVVYFKDNSEQRKLQENINNNMHNMRSLINNTSDRVWSVDKNFTIISANQAFIDNAIRVIGHTVNPRDPALPKELGEQHIKDRKEQYTRALQGEAFTAVDERVIEGVMTYRETKFSPIKDENDNIIGVSCFSRDITERKRHLMKIEVQNEKLKEIAWIQSHKVRGPLATIMGLSNLFNTIDTTDPSNKKIIRGIAEEAQRLDDIIREVVKKTYDI